MNEITKLLEIEYPIIQGAMAWIANHKIASAVSNGGGFGIVAAGSAPAEFIREEIKKTRELTDKPFGVNVMLLSPEVDEIMEMLVEEKVAAVTTGAGNPGKYIERLKAVGTKVIPVVASVALARRLERIGVDAIIAEGSEAGGHIGEISTMALVPMVVDALNIPVIAAGGIADGRGVAAAFMLGAKGIQVGTRFLAANECDISREYKDMILKAKDSDITVTGRSTGHPCRVVKNRMTKDILKLEKQGITAEEFEEKLAGTLRAAVVDGDVTNGSVMSGHVAGLVNKEQPAAEIIEEMFREAKEIYESRSDFFGTGCSVPGNGK